MWSARTLLVTDPNLGAEAHARLAPLCGDLTWLSWDVARPADAARLLARIEADRWSLAISFYSDLVFPVAALEAIELPLNIHPALPRIRGVGHDIVPLVERHATVGVTLHRIDPPIDTGKILDVFEVPVPPGATYGSLRALNQASSLRMLDRLCAAMTASTDLAGLERRLARATPHAWSDAYYSRKQVAALRERHRETLGIGGEPLAAIGHEPAGR